MFNFKVISTKADAIPGEASMILREFDSETDNKARTFTFESQQDCETFQAAFKHHVAKALSNPELRNMSWIDDCNKSRALWRAAGQGDIAVSTYLIEAGADLEWLQPNQQQQTPLHMAVLRGQCGTAELLLKRGANVKAKHEALWTPLHVAAHKGDEDICVLLIKHGAAADAVNDQNETPLHKSVTRV